MLRSHPLDRPWSRNLSAEPLGEGGQGVVTRVRGPEKLVYKEYLRNAGTPYAPALAELVEFGRTLPEHQSRSLEEQSAWPLARVIREGTVTGFLMHEIPAEFTGRIGGKNRPLELQYLLYEPNHTWDSLHLPDGPGRVEVAAAATRFISFLHSHRFVLGDISFRNLLWSEARPHRVFMLDCDGVRRHGAEPVLPQAQTPEWDDPHLPRSGLDLDTDRYKVALLVGRVLSRNAYVRPGQELRLIEGIDSQVSAAVTRLFDRAAGPYGLRPTAEEWLQALLGRKWIAVSAPPVRVQEPPPKGRVPLVRSGQQRSYRPFSLPGRTVPPPPPASRPQAGTSGSLSSGQSSEPPASASPTQVEPAARTASTSRRPVNTTDETSLSTPAESVLGMQIVTSEAFADQRDLVTCKLTEEQMALLIDHLVRAGGRSPIGGLARLLNEPSDRMVMVLGTACQLLNLDDEQVLALRDDDRTLELDIPLLKEQFLEVTS